MPLLKLNEIGEKSQATIVFSNEILMKFLLPYIFRKMFIISHTLKHVHELYSV